jgi:ABC-type cobalt transport system substrate-binding protein
MRAIDNLNYFLTINHFDIDWTFIASPIWEHKGGNIPIHFFGSPFEIFGSESRHCLHGGNCPHPNENYIYDFFSAYMPYCSLVEKILHTAQQTVGCICILALIYIHPLGFRVIKGQANQGN